MIREKEQAALNKIKKELAENPVMSFARLNCLKPHNASDWFYHKLAEISTAEYDCEILAVGYVPHYEENFGF